jgi:hypothetical protein
MLSETPQHNPTYTNLYDLYGLKITATTNVEQQTTNVEME